MLKKEAWQREAETEPLVKMIHGGTTCPYFRVPDAMIDEREI